MACSAGAQRDVAGVLGVGKVGEALPILLQSLEHYEKEHTRDHRMVVKGRRQSEGGAYYYYIPDLAQFSPLA